MKSYGLLVHMRRGYDVGSVLQEFPEHYRQYIVLVPNTAHCEVRVIMANPNLTEIIFKIPHFYGQYDSLEYGRMYVI